MPKPLPIATYLQASIHALGETQGGFAHRVGVSRSLITKLLNGRRRVTVELAPQLAKVTGTSAAEWLARQAAVDLYKTQGGQ